MVYMFWKHTTISGYLAGELDVDVTGREMNAYAESYGYGRSRSLALMITLAQAKDKKQPDDCYTSFEDSHSASDVQRLESCSTGALKLQYSSCYLPVDLKI